MANYDEFPRGQLSTIILMCLSETDKYGYEIIDEVLKKTNGRLSIKQPSLYSSLKRMEEQSLISSYWRDSEIGGRRHYYHLTDLGRKHLDKWQANVNLQELAGDKPEPQNKVLQQESLFNLAKSEPKEEVKQECNTNGQTFVQFDLFTKPPIAPADNDSTTLKNQISLDDHKEKLETKEQTPIMTSYEKVDFVPTIKKFDYIKKGKSFSDSIKEVTSFEEKRYIEKPAENLSMINKESNPFKEINQNDNNNSIQIEEIVGPKSTISIKDLQGYNFSQETNNIKESNTLLDNLEEVENTNFLYDDIKQDTIVSEPPAQNQTLNYLNTQSVNTNQPKQEEPVKDDAVFITERLDIKDLPKPTKWENRRFEIYLSDNSISPKFKASNNEKYEDRVKDLYEKSKSNAENQELELIDSKIKFNSYKDLQEFYKSQNIKFKPYQKTLYKSEKNFDMIRITKLNLFTSLLMLGSFIVISLICGLALSSFKNAHLNNFALYTVIPIIFVLATLFAFIQYQKSPQKRIAYDVNRFKFNKAIFFTNLLMLPVIISINVLFGFDFSNFTSYIATIIYPSILIFTYLIHYTCKRILTKFKLFY